MPRRRRAPAKFVESDVYDRPQSSTGDHCHPAIQSTATCQLPIQITTTFVCKSLSSISHTMCRSWRWEDEAEADAEPDGRC